MLIVDKKSFTGTIEVDQVFKRLNLANAQHALAVVSSVNGEGATLRSYDEEQEIIVGRNAHVKKETLLNKKKYAFVGYHKDTN